MAKHRSITEDEINKAYKYLTHYYPHITKGNSTIRKSNAGNYCIVYKDNTYTVLSDAIEVASQTKSCTSIFDRLTEDDITNIIIKHPKRRLIENIKFEKIDRDNARVYITLKPEITKVKGNVFDIKADSIKSIKRSLYSVDVIEGVSDELKEEARKYIEGCYKDIEKFTEKIPKDLLELSGFHSYSKTYTREEDTFIFYRKMDTNVTCDGILSIGYEDIKYKYDLLNNINISKENPFERYKNEITQYQNSWNKVSKFLLNGKEKYNWNISVVPKKDAYKIVMMYENFKKEFLLSNSSYKQDMEEIKNKIKEYTKENHQITKNRIKEKTEKMKKSPLYGSILAVAIYDLLSKNRRMSITSIVSNLRGVKESTYSYLSNTQYSGRFNWMSEDEIKDAVEEMTKLGVLKSYQSKNDYMRYDVYMTGDEESYEALTSPKNKKYENFTDLDWQLEIKQNTYGTENVVEKLSVFEHPALFCINTLELAQYLRSAPESVIEYATSLQSQMKGSTKRSLRTVLCIAKSKSFDEIAEA